MPQAVNGMKQCADCKSVKTVSEYGLDSRRADRCRPYCNPCIARRSKRLRDKRNGRPEIAIPGNKFCTGCKTAKIADAFVSNKNNLDGLNRHCRECCSKTFAERRKRYAASAAILRADGNKRCKTCKEHKPIENFNQVKGNRDHLEDSCKPCSKRRATHRYLKCTYGISLAEYQAMSDAQNHLCYLCLNPETLVNSKDGIVSRLAVDHSHDGTNTVRKLLCNRCNLSIGGLEYLIEKGLLAESIKYLQDHASAKRAFGARRMG